MLHPGMNDKKKRKIEMIFFIFICITSICFSVENREDSGSESVSESSKWFRKYGDYLVYLTLQKASPREHMLFVSSNWSFFETGVGKRLRLGSPTKDFHWGIEFSIFTSLTRYGVWNFKNICCDAKYGFFGLFHVKPLIFLIRLNHYCSNLLQGAPEFSQPIKFSQYSIYGQFFCPAKTLSFIPGVKLIKPYFGFGTNLHQFPESHHIPFDFGIEIEFQEFIFPHKALHIGFHCAYNGMRRLVPTCSLFLGWGTLDEVTVDSLPFSIGVFYQWGQDARGQFYQQNRELLGARFNIVF